MTISYVEYRGYKFAVDFYRELIKHTDAFEREIYWARKCKAILFSSNKLHQYTPLHAKFLQSKLNSSQVTFNDGDVVENINGALGVLEIRDNTFYIHDNTTIPYMYGDLEQVAVEWKVLSGDDVWKKREENRMKNEYMPIDTMGLITFNPEHYVHWAIEAGERRAKIAYTPDASYGKQDRQVVMKLGKYLRKYHSLSDGEIAHIVSELSTKQISLDILTDPKEIASAYRYITCSCMGGRDVEINGTHPAEVYGDSPDVAVAYIEGYARAVLNQKNKTYYKIYGDASRMRSMLTSLGYTSGKGISGCLIRRIEYMHGYIMPYIDGAQSIYSYDSEYFMVGGGGAGSYVGEAGETGGTMGVGCKCACCGEHFDEDKLNYVGAEEQMVCERCLENEFVFAHLGRFEEWIRQDSEEVWEYCGEFYTQDGLEYHDLIVYNGEVYPLDECAGDYLTEELCPIAEMTSFWHVRNEEVLYTTETHHLSYVPECLRRYTDGEYYAY